MSPRKSRNRWRCLFLDFGTVGEHEDLQLQHGLFPIPAILLLLKVLEENGSEINLVGLLDMVKMMVVLLDLVMMMMVVCVLIT